MWVLKFDSDKSMQMTRHRLSLKPTSKLFVANLISKKKKLINFHLSIYSATIENGTLISHDLHNALAVIKNGEVMPQQQPPQNAAIAVASTATTTTVNNGTTTASHSGSSGRSTPNNTDSAPGKLFVGGLSWQTSADKLKEYFGMFGNVTDVLIMKDPVTQVKLSTFILPYIVFQCCK